MISNDTIMKSPYDINADILHLISEISTKLGEVKAYFLQRQSPQLRKQNRIKTIHSSLNIEGNTLTVEQITAIVDNKKVIGPEKDVKEVLNAIKVYNNLTHYAPKNQESFLKAHKVLMNGLVDSPGKYRNKGVGIIKGNNLAHVAPPAENVLHLMTDLFDYLQNDKDIALIKSCIFHYEMEFIHPFIDGNGRMGRLWQTLILLQEYPVFEFLPFETLIAKDQELYYRALVISDQSGKSTAFIEYMLSIINGALKDLLNVNNRTLSSFDRIEFFRSLGTKSFTRKDYMNSFKNISSATASRDLQKGVEKGLLAKTGSLNQTIYMFK
jgi:Fic family protein